MKKNQILYLATSAVIGALVTIGYFAFTGSDASQVPFIPLLNPQKEIKGNIPPTTQVPTYCEYNFKRLKGYKYIKPLMDGEPECESGKLQSLKGEIMTEIDNQVKSGSLTYASVYLKNLNTNDWMVINPALGFHPGSLIKVAVLISYLRMAETNPNLMNSVVDYNKDNTVYPVVQYKSDTIILGNKYKIKDLLYFMIAHSDNRATVVLENIMDMNVFRKTFSDLGLQELSFSDTSYRISAKVYSNFFSVIYNAGYFSISSSEFAASMLAESTFKEGLMKLLPQDVKVAHKFGEWGNGYQKELHETGIVYLNGNPYLLTVMTNGTDWNSLSNVLGKISKIVYDRMNIYKS